MFGDPEERPKPTEVKDDSWLRQAVDRARARWPGRVIEVECDTFDQVREAVAARAEQERTLEALRRSQAAAIERTRLDAEASARVFETIMSGQVPDSDLAAFLTNVLDRPVFDAVWTLPAATATLRNQRSCHLRRNLVLDGDMRPPAGRVLRGVIAF